MQSRQLSLGAYVGREHLWLDSTELEPTWHAGRVHAVALAHATFTLLMCGLMVGVQLVVYPQFRSVPEPAFGPYVAAHSRHIVTALALFAPLEVVTAGWLFLDTPDALSSAAVFVAGALLAVGWIATAVWYAPLHGRLQSEPYDEERINLLVRTNWARTTLWIARAGLATWFVWQIIDSL